jgi:oligosaccharide repeat unit polymerase
MSFFTIKVLLFKKKINFSLYKPKDILINENLFKIFKIWLIFTVFEILYFRGLPLLGLFGIGGNESYTEWGIPSLHGFLNAIVITLSNYLFYYYITKKNKKYIKLFLVCLLWSVLLVTRQMFLSMVIHAVFIYILCNKVKVYSILKVLFIALLVVILFGIVGDLRSGDPEAFLYLAQPTSEYPTWLPSGFLWFYIYIVSPLNNVNFNISNYSNFDFNLIPLISSFFPSFIKDKIFPPTIETNFQLVNEYLNVSTMFPKYLDSFGYFGSIFFYYFIGLFISYFYFKYRTDKLNPKWMFCLIIIFHNIIFSVFVDFFFNLVFIFQFILHFFISKSHRLEYDKN